MENKGIIRLTIQIVVAFILTVVLFYFFNSKSSFENLALGTQTITYHAKDNKNKRIHFLHLDSIENSYFLDYSKNTEDSITLFLGNSQTHSINQLKNNQVNYVELLSKKMNHPCVAFSFPNANLQEHLLTLDYVTSKFKIKQLVLPVFMDDLREDCIREAFFSELYNQGYELNSRSRVANRISMQLKKTSKHEAVTVERTTQEKTENYLDNQLAKNTSFWKKREKMRGEILNWLYMLRNTVFGLKPSTVRKMIPDSYQRNFEALDAILDLAKSKKIKMFLYIPPIRSDVTLPYDINEYNKFKFELLNFSQKYKSKFADFSKIVPGTYWGYKEATNFIDKREFDYMHFQYKGHQILADSILNYIR